ncbi:MAG: PilZ domain-containing protein [Bdellovibrionales bacterium]|nr:PilZ domain-containing protein [Bdellovibrionales bacterium]
MIIVMYVDDKERRKRGDRTPVKIDVNLKSMGPYYLSKLSNLSKGGAFIQHPKPEAVGSHLEISFTLPEQSQTITLKARVAWTYIQPGKAEPNGTGMGVQFLDVKADEEEQIQTYISALKLDL